MHRFPTRSVNFRPVAVTAACTALLVGCIGARPACETGPAEIEMTLTSETLAPSSPEVCRGADVTLSIHPEVDGVFHIHGYDAEVPATEVLSGEVLELTFTAARSGQFPIELHTDENTQGVNVGLLTVNEP